MASLVKDYETYKKSRNITFIGVNSSTTATLKTMASQVDQFKLKPFANMLDAGGATASAYGVPPNSPFWLVVIDGGGKIAYNASRGWFWSSGPDAGKTIHSTQIEKSLKEYPEGILGADPVPADMETVAHFYDLQQFALLEPELKKAEAKSASPASKAFASRVRSRIADSRTFRKSQIEEMSASDPVQAFREATAFVAAFPNAPERAAVNDLGRELVKQPAVKKEMEAEAAFHAMLVPELKRTQTLEKYIKNIQPLVDAYMKKYGTTKYATAVKGACDAHRMAVSAK